MEVAKIVRLPDYDDWIWDAVSEWGPPIRPAEMSMQDCQQRLGTLLFVAEPTSAPGLADTIDSHDDNDAEADGAEPGDSVSQTAGSADPAHIDDDDTGADAPAVTRRPVDGWWHGGKWILPAGRYVKEAVADAAEPPPRRPTSVRQRPAGRPSSSPPVQPSSSSLSTTPPAEQPAEQPAEDAVVYDISEPVRRPGESEHSFKKRLRAAACSRRRQSGAPALHRVVEVPMCVQCHVHQPGAYCTFRLCAPCCRQAANSCEQPGHSD